MMATAYIKTCGSITTTTATSDVTATDIDTSYYGNYYEYEKTETEEKMQNVLQKEELNIPSFKVAKHLHNIKQVKTFVVNKQRNFNIRNAL